MSEMKTKKQDVYIEGIKYDVPPEKRYTWLKPAKDTRADAFPESEKKPTDARRK